MTVCKTCEALGGLHKHWCAELPENKPKPAPEVPTFVAHSTNHLRSIGIEDPKADHPVHHPNHYTAYKGLEIIDLTEQMNFCRGNAVKYIARAGLKSKEHEIQDLQKAAWYINREIERLENAEG